MLFIVLQCCFNFQVRAFHAKYYLPQNCEVIISGTINHDDVFRALDEVEKGLIERKLAERPFKRPWTSPLEPLKIETGKDEAVKEVILKCPSDDEKSGVVSIGWRGPLGTVSLFCLFFFVGTFFKLYFFGFRSVTRSPRCLFYSNI